MIPEDEIEMNETEQLSRFKKAQDKMYHIIMENYFPHYSRGNH